MLRHVKLRMKIKIKNNKMISFRTDDEKLSEKYKAIWTKFKDLKWN